MYDLIPKPNPISASHFDPIAAFDAPSTMPALLSAQRLLHLKFDSQ